MPTLRTHHPAPDHDVSRFAIRESIRNGLWFIPCVMIAATCAVGFAISKLDEHQVRVAGSFQADASSAQTLLATIAASTLTMTTLVVSITIVALQLASQQFSPRVMRTFFRDTGTKVALGIFLSTTVYALLVLRIVVPLDGRRAEYVPAISVSLAFVLMLCSLGTFLYFLHHVAHSIRAVHIMESVAAETRRAIRDRHCPDDRLAIGEWPDRHPDLVLLWEHAPGAIVGIDEDDLVLLAQTKGVRIELLQHVGAYLPSTIPFAHVWADDPTLPPKVSTGEVTRFVGVGRERTMRQDVAFGFRQLVDIAEKALSPAVNDPTTGVQALDRIHDLIRRIAVHPDPCPLYRDHEGAARLVVPVDAWDEMVHLAFDEIRRYGAESLQIHMRMRRILDDLIALLADRPDRLRPLVAQRQLLDRSAERSFLDPEDLRRASPAHVGP